MADFEVWTRFNYSSHKFFDQNCTRASIPSDFFSANKHLFYCQQQAKETIRGIMTQHVFVKVHTTNSDAIQVAEIQIYENQGWRVSLEIDKLL